MEHSAAHPALLSWMSALADVIRARILRVVERHELTVADLCDVLQLPQSTVSRHLKVLADEGWVTVRPEGTSRLYRMADGLDTAARRLWALLREQTADTPATAQDDHRLQSILARRQTQSQAFFSTTGGQWDRLRREMFGDRFDVHAFAALLDDDWSVGDFGCGTGELAETLAPFVRRVIAVDRSRDMLRAARKRLASCDNVEIRQGELEDVPVDSGSLDAVVLGLVLHHVADPARVLREAARVLRRGGRLLVIDMLAHDRREYQQKMGHVWLGFDTGQLTAWLDAAGLDRVRIRPLPSAPKATGPALLVASARRPSTAPIHATNHNPNGHSRRNLE